MARSKEPTASPSSKTAKDPSAAEPPSSSKTAGADIRSFLGGGANASKRPPKPNPAAIEVSDSDEDMKPTIKSSSKRPIEVSDSSEEEQKPSKSKPKAPTKTATATKASKRKAADSSESDEYEEVKKPAAKRQSVGKANAARKTKAKVEDDEDFEMEDAEDVKPVKKAAAKPKAAPKKAPAAAAESAASSSKPKFDFAAAAARKAAGPTNPGGKEIPEGEEDCLAGLTLVFTGELSTIAREEATELAKRYGAVVTGAPSGKTSYVVVGENAGPSKLKKIQEKKIPILDEDGFLDLIRTRGSGGQLTEAQAKAKAKKEQEIQAQAEEMKKREQEEAAKAKRKAAVMGKQGGAVKPAPPPPSAQLWTTRYAPKSLKEICGNKTLVERLGQWLEGWPKFYADHFKKGGKDGFGAFRAVLISGPPGIGKTTSAHLMAKLKGYSVIEMNASDTRSKKLLQNATNVDNASLDGWFGGGDVTSVAAAGVRVNSRSCLIMDEVDGMSAGDRGGVGALNLLIKKTKIPIILICNDITLQKMKPLYATTFALKFRRPGAQEIRSRLMSIMFKENMQVPPNALDQLVASSQSDIRQILNMLSTWSLNKTAMTFDESKRLGEMSEKYSITTPFNLVPKVIGPISFSHTNRDTLNDKMEYYFQDFSFMPLFIQENYLRNSPARVKSSNPQEASMKTLELFSKAADSISDGDLIDRMIHGQEQHWSLLPAHAIASTVRPGYHIYGGSSEPGYSPVAFPQWLGQNSKQQKLGRQLGDVQVKMRLRVTGSRGEIRQDYLPILSRKIIQPLTKKNAPPEIVDEVIETLDEYYLNKEDWDALVELGVGTMAGIDSKIPTALKTSLTRQYNKADHPIAFHKGEMFGGKKVIVDKGPAPDNEDLLGEEEEAAEEIADDDDAAGEEDDTEVLKRDKLIKMAGPKKGKAVAAADPKAKAKAATKKK